MNISDPTALSAVITGASTIIAATIAALAAGFVGQKFAKIDKLKEEAETAIKDVHFLLKVEQRHCELHKERTGKSNLRRVRQQVKENSGLAWSGRYTPGRVADRQK